MNIYPLYIEAGITGFESPAAEYTELGLSLDNLLIANANATFIGLANGSSMEKVGIYSGDLLIVDRSQKPNNKDIIVANFNGTFVCKIIDITTGTLLSASDEHAPVKINEGDVFQLEGVVISAVRIFKDRQRLMSCLP